LTPTTIISDLRCGICALSKNPGFSIVALLILALASGAKTAVFSMVNAESHHSLPEHSDQLVSLAARTKTSDTMLLALGHVAPQAQGKQVTTEPLMAAVARKDGVIVPFGLYKSGHWSRIGPATCSDKPMPSNTAEALAAFGEIGRIPPAWFLWTEDGKHPLVMKVSKPVTVQSHCCQQWGLATGPNTVFKADSFPFPKLGVALSKPLKVELMSRLDAAEAEAKSLLTFLSPRFGSFEDVALHAKQDNAGGLELRDVLHALYGASIGSPRQPVPLKLHSAYRSRNAVNGRTLFYVEVFKEYPAASCPVVAHGSFWISKDPPGSLTLLNQNGTSVGFVDCDWKGAESFTPFGMFLADNLTYVLGQSNGWENEEYVILEIFEDRAHSVLQVNGGGC